MKRLLPCLLLLAPVLHAVPERPNIVVILADDLGWGDLGCYPNGEAWGEEAVVSTPNLDTLASSGVLCMQAYATGMVCAPSRAGLLTGQYQQRFGFYAFAETVAPIPKSLKLLPEVLREEGYRTALIGKWHFSSHPSSTPLKRGFDRFFGFIGGQHDFFDANLGTPMQGVSWTNDAYVFDQDKPVESVKYLTDGFTDRAIGFMAESRETGKPFFLFLAHHDPHPPNQAPWKDLEPFATREGKRPFTSRDIAKASIVNMDDNVGRIMKWLHDEDLASNTLVIFSSDNGGSDAGPERVLQHNGGLRGRKSTFYEGGIRVPFIASWPGHLPEGVIYDKPISLLDIYATALALAEAEERREDIQQLDGTNLIPYLTGTNVSAPHARLFWSIETPRHWAVRDGDWKLVLEDTDPATIGAGAKSTGRPREFRLQLFDLANDSFEENDLAEKRPEVVERMQVLFDEFVAQSKPSLYTAQVQAAHEAILVERAKDSSLANQPTTTGAPGHWFGKGAEARLEQERLAREREL